MTKASSMLDIRRGSQNDLNRGSGAKSINSINSRYEENNRDNNRDDDPGRDITKLAAQAGAMVFPTASGRKSRMHPLLII
jgi:hypothetical protein